MPVAMMTKTRYYQGPSRKKTLGTGDIRASLDHIASQTADGALLKSTLNAGRTAVRETRVTAHGPVFVRGYCRYMAGLGLARPPRWLRPL